MIGGFFDRFAQAWDEAEIAWFEALLEEEDVEIMGWAIGAMSVPARWEGAMMERMRVLDYSEVAK